MVIYNDATLVSVYESSDPNVLPTGQMTVSESKSNVMREKAGEEPRCLGTCISGAACQVADILRLNKEHKTKIKASLVSLQFITTFSLQQISWAKELTVHTSIPLPLLLFVKAESLISLI